MNLYDVPFIKIPSALITDHNLLIACSNIEKPIMISTGMSTMSQITDAISLLNKSESQELIVLHCNSSYPSKDPELDLNMINTLKREMAQCEKWGIVDMKLTIFQVLLHGPWVQK